MYKQGEWKIKSINKINKPMNFYRYYFWEKTTNKKRGETDGRYSN